MAIYQYKDFNYAGIASTSKGVKSVQINKGLFEETVIPNRKIIETRIRGTAKSYLHGIDQDPLEFELFVYLKEGYTETEYEDVLLWLAQRTYQPFYVVGAPKTKIAYCMPAGEIDLSHTGGTKGYISVTMQCNSPYLYSPVIQTTQYNLSANTTAGTLITLNNTGHFPTKPYIEIYTTAVGTVKIVNESANNHTFQFSDLANAETIKIDNEREDIISDIPQMYRYKNFNMNFLELNKGENKLRVYGLCKILFKYEYIYIA